MMDVYRMSPVEFGSTGLSVLIALCQYYTDRLPTYTTEFN